MVVGRDPSLPHTWSIVPETTAHCKRGHCSQSQGTRFSTAVLRLRRCSRGRAREGRGSQWIRHSREGHPPGAPSGCHRKTAAQRRRDPVSPSLCQSPPALPRLGESVARPETFSRPQTRGSSPREIRLFSTSRAAAPQRGAFMREDYLNWHRQHGMMCHQGQSPTTRGDSGHGWFGCSQKGVASVAWLP